MRDLAIGMKGSFTLLVGPEHLASQFKDPILPPVFATPMMVLAMENAALNAIRDCLETGESAVGTAVNIRHIAATPAGQRVTANAEVTQIDGHRIVFAVEAHDETGKIGEGTHERVLVDLHRMQQGLDKKAR